MRTLPYGLIILAIGSIGYANATAAAEPAATGTKQAFPWKAIQIIVPSPAGSPPDARARQLAERLSPALGQPVIILNKPGAGGAIGMQAGATSIADGHTIVFCTDAPLTINPSVYSKLPYDPVKDFLPIMQVHKVPLVLVASPLLHVASIAELIKLAKDQPGKLLYGSAGNGTPPHIFADLFKFIAGIDLVHVPYKGGPAATMALLSGEVGFTFDAVSQVLPHMQTGKLRPLAVTGDNRIAALPDVPTFAEVGIAGMSASWTALVAPTGTPQDTVMRLHQEFSRILLSPSLKAYYETIGMSVIAGSPEELGKRIAEEISKWRDVVRRAGITPG